MLRPRFPSGDEKVVALLWISEIRAHRWGGVRFRLACASCPSRARRTGGICILAPWGAQPRNRTEAP